MQRGVRDAVFIYFIFVLSKKKNQKKEADVKRLLTGSPAMESGQPWSWRGKLTEPAFRVCCLVLIPAGPYNFKACMLSVSRRVACHVSRMWNIYCLYYYGNEQSRLEQQEPYVSPAPGGNPSPGSLEALRAERAIQRSAGPPSGGDGVGWGGGGAARAEQLEAAWRAQQASLLLGLFVPSRPAWVTCLAREGAALRAAFPCNGRQKARKP